MLVCVHPAAPVGVAGVLQGVQEDPEDGREGRGLNTP